MIPDDRHPSTDELADCALGALERAQATAINAHVARCAPCRKLLGQLYGLPELLSNIRYPPIPEPVTIRIGTALADAVRQRADLFSARSGTWGRQGVVDSPAGLGPFYHLCWVFNSTADWADCAVEYMADGVVAGQCVQLFGDASTATLRAEVAELLSSMPASRAAAAGAVEVRDLADHFECADDGIADPEATMAARQAALVDALAAGYTGLRTIADCTPVVRTEAQRDAATRLEFLGDRAMKSLPMAGMCSYNAADIGPDAAAEMACVHPLICQGAAPFRLYPERDADFGLAGRIDDVAAEALFRTALERTPPPAGSELIVDARRADSIDDRALADLDAHAARMGRTAVVRMTKSNSPSTAALSSLTSLRVEVSKSS